MQYANPIELAVFNNKLGAIAEEMGAVIERTAYTTFVKETHDFGAGLATPEGTYFAYPLKSGPTSQLAGDVSDAVKWIKDWQPGDIVLTNDPHSSGAMATHLPDLHLLAPVFVEGELVAFCWGFIHSSDVGGRVPGSIAPSSDEIYQEGLRLPPSKLYRAGEINKELFDIIEANVRIPYHVWGDIKAVMSAFHVGSARLTTVFKKYGLTRTKELIQESMEYAEAKARAILERIPDGTYRFVDYLESDLVSDIPIRIELAITVKGSDIHLDYTGTDPQVSAAFNIVTGGKPHAWLTIGIVHHLRSMDPTIPPNGALVRSIRVTAPAGTIVNAVMPAAVGSRITTGLKVYDVTLGALAQAIPDRVPAAGSGNGMLGVMSMPNLAKGGRKMNVFQVLVGGSGGRPHSDGYDGTNASFSFMRNTPVEAIEAEMDMLVHSYHYVQDSAGPGRFRGGLGVGMTVEALIPDTVVAMRGMGRTRFAPWGVHGGQFGACTSPARYNAGRADERSIEKLDVLGMRRGDTLTLASSGAGGYGNPWERDMAAVRDDVMFGFVSRAKAAEAYGVIFKGTSFEIDLAASEAKRELLKKAGHNRRGVYAYGAYREKHDQVWSTESRDRIMAILGELTVPAQVYAKNLVMQKALDIFSERSLETIGGREIDEAWQATRNKLGLEV